MLNRYDLSQKWSHEPWAKSVGKKNNIILFGGGLGVYRDLHEPNPALRYKISGGSPAGCYSDNGAENCAVATAGSPDGINSWSEVKPLRFPKPWRPDCHTNLFYGALPLRHDTSPPAQDPLPSHKICAWACGALFGPCLLLTPRRCADNVSSQYYMTTRNYEKPGREISISHSGGATSSNDKHWTGGWKLLENNSYPLTTDAGSSITVRPSAGQSIVEACGERCRTTANCAYFFVYTSGRSKGHCFPKASVDGSKSSAAACTPSKGGCESAFFQVRNPDPRML